MCKSKMLVLRACTEWLYSLMLPRNLRERVCVQHILLPGKCQVPLTTGKRRGLMRTTVLTDLWLLPLRGNGKDMIVLAGGTRPTHLPALACPKPCGFHGLCGTRLSNCVSELVQPSPNKPNPRAA